MEIKQYQEKWLKHVQRMDTNRLPKQAIKYKEEMEGPTSSGGSRNRLTCLTLQEHDDDDDDDDVEVVHVLVLIIEYLSGVQLL